MPNACIKQPIPHHAPQKLLYISLVSFSLSPSVRPLYSLCLNKQIRACRLSTRWKSQLAVSTYRAPLIYIELTYTQEPRAQAISFARIQRERVNEANNRIYFCNLPAVRAHPFSLIRSFCYLQIGALACTDPNYYTVGAL
jgi:hypothetical protein